MSTHLIDCLYRVPFRRYRPLNLPLNCKVVQKGVLSPRFAGERGYPRFWSWTCVIKSQLLPSMWPILVGFHSASSEIRRRKKERKKKESVVKHKSADRYVERPNYCKQIHASLLPRAPANYGPVRLCVCVCVCDHAITEK